MSIYQQSFQVFSSHCLEKQCSGLRWPTKKDQVHIAAEHPRIGFLVFQSSREGKSTQRTLNQQLSFRAHSRQWIRAIEGFPEERGDAHHGEPCSRWQTSEVRVLDQLGGKRGAFHSCEFTEIYGGQALDEPAPIGFMANFPVAASAVRWRWPQIRPEGRQYTGLLKNKGACRSPQTSLKESTAMKRGANGSVCAQFLSALPRLPEDWRKLNMGK